MVQEAIAIVPDTRSVPLAWRNLVANKRRLIRSSAGIGFAVLLMSGISAFLSLGRLRRADPAEIF